MKQHWKGLKLGDYSQRKTFACIYIVNEDDETVALLYADTVADCRDIGRDFIANFDGHVPHVPGPNAIINGGTGNAPQPAD
jgi:hypothetical protein